MKKYSLLLVFFMFTLPCVNAQEDLLVRYDQKVVENNDLKKEIEKLEGDIASLKDSLRKQISFEDELQSALDSKDGIIRDLNEDKDKCKESKEKIEQDFQNLKEDFGGLQSEISRLRKDSIKAEKRKKDFEKYESVKNSRDSLQTAANDLEKQLANAKDEKESLLQQLEEKEDRLQQYQKILTRLASVYQGKKTDDLFATKSYEEVIGDRELYRLLSPEDEPSVLEGLIRCYEARSLCSEPYDVSKISNAVSYLKGDTKTEKAIRTLLSNYKTINLEATQLWENIRSEVLQTPIDNESFPQLQAKRAVWQRTQKFLNKYPNMAKDYPYVYEQLQSMIGKVWDNANNFTNLPNPFNQQK